MKSEFQDVFKDAYDHWIDDACSHRYNASKSLALQVWQHQQSKVDELQKRVDAQTKHIETALLAVKDIHKSARDEFMEWDVLAEKAPKLCQHMQDLSVAVGELEQALKGGE